LDPESIPERIDRFRLERELSRTPVSRTFLARWEETKERVALKLMREGSAPGLTPESLGLIAHEGEVAKILDHDNVVRILKVGVEGPWLFVAQKPVPGISLRQYLDKAGAIAPRTAAEIALEVSKALAFAHGRGLFHKNLKSSNVFIRKDGRIAVADFGIARFPDPLDKSLRGTDYSHRPEFLPPEQAAGDYDRVDQRGDVFALGVLLYEMLTGASPYTGAEGGLSYFHILHEVPPPPRKRRRSVPRALDAVCEKAMEKKAQDRYGSMPEMALDLKRFLSGETVLALEDRKARRWTRRFLASWGGLTAVFLIALGLAFAGAVLLRNLGVSGGRGDGGRRTKTLPSSKTPDDRKTLSKRKREARAALASALELPCTRENLDQRIALFHQALEMDPDFWRAHLHLGYDLLLSGRVQRAQTSLARGSAGEESAFGKYLWGIVYHEYLMDRSLALKDFQEGTRAPAAGQYGTLCEAWVLWLAEGESQKALAALELADEERAYPWETGLLRGIVLQACRKEDLWAARLAFSRSTEAFGGYAPALVRRAVAFLAENRTTLAVKDLEAALDIDPTNAHARFRRGVLRFQQGELEKARLDFELARETAPRFWDAHFFEGDTLIRLGRHREAVRALSRSLEIRPGYAPAVQKRGYAYFSLRDFEKAEADYREAVKLDPYSAEMQYHLGKFFHALGRMQEALKPFEKAVRLAPKASVYHEALADLHFSLTRYQEAFTEYEMAITCDPGRPWNYWRSALILYLHQDSPELALDRLETGLSKFPEGEAKADEDLQKKMKQLLDHIREK